MKNSAAGSKPFMLEADSHLDTSGLRCPMPVLLAQKQLRTMQPGQIVYVLSTDSVAWDEIPAFCEQAGHTLLRREQEGGHWRFWIRKPGE